MKKIFFGLVLLLFSGCSWEAQDLQSSLVNIEEVQMGEDQTWGEFCSQKITTFDELRKRDSICEEFNELHEAWEEDFRFLILDSDEDQDPILGLTYLSGKNVDIYTKELQKSFDITEEIRKLMEKTLKNACTVCNEKQKLQAPCIWECK